AGKLDAVHFRRAWQWAVDRHAILRTAFSWEGLDQPLQMVQRAAALPWKEQDWRGLSQEGLSPVDLTRGPLVRLVLFERGLERSARLQWVIHHLAVDGVSWRILLEDLDQVYRRLERGEVVSLPPRTTSCASAPCWCARTAPGTGAWWLTVRPRESRPQPSSAISCRRDCRSTWCRRPWRWSRSCRSTRPARSIAPR
ncbi:MAG: hypothetical protein GY856_37215, partial [bacterium]|nr:hypothetical protein [bacterium]